MSVWHLPAITAPITSLEIWADLLERHDNLYQLFGPPIFCRSVGIDPAGLQLATLTDAVVHEWRYRGLGDELALVTRISARAVTDTGTLSVTVGAGTPVDVTIDSEAWRIYHVITPVAGPGPEEVVLSATVPSGDEIRLRSVECFVLTVPIASRPETASGVLAAPSAAVGRPITTEHVERGLAAPILLARERPLLVFNHSAPVFASGQLTGSWGVAVGAGAAAVNFVVGRGTIGVPLDAEARPRTYVVDVLWSRADGSAVGDLKVGEAPAIRVEAPGWYARNVTAPPGVDVTGLIRPEADAAANRGRYDTIQIWQMPAATEASP